MYTIENGSFKQTPNLINKPYQDAGKYFTYPLSKNYWIYSLFIFNSILESRNNIGHYLCKPLSYNGIYTRDASSVSVQ